MMKYAIKLTKGNDYKIIEIFDSKDAAMIAGAEYREQISRDDGLMACIEAEFDDEGNMIGTGYRLLEVFF